MQDTRTRQRTATSASSTLPLFRYICCQCGAMVDYVTHPQSELGNMTTNQWSPPMVAAAFDKATTYLDQCCSTWDLSGNEEALHVLKNAGVLFQEIRDDLTGLRPKWSDPAIVGFSPERVIAIGIECTSKHRHASALAREVQRAVLNAWTLIAADLGVRMPEGLGR